MTSPSGNRYLVWFGHNNSYFNFRFAELESLAHKYGVSVNGLYDGDRMTATSTDPFAIVRLPNDDLARAICRDSVLIKHIVELWGSGATDNDVITDVKNSVSKEKWDLYFVNKPFAYKVIGYGIQYTEQERRDRMMAFTPLFDGYEKVNLKKPDTILFVIDNYYVYNFDQTGTRDETLPVKKLGTFYGREISIDSSSSGFRNKFTLVDRPVLGPTSLDNDLAFIMTNFGEIKSGSTILDPFCGTGGLLIAATATAGGYAPQTGCDIDIRVLSGEFVSYFRNKLREDMTLDIFENFRHYKLPLPEIIACDNSSRCWKSGDVSSPVPQFDLILTDPPYGVRAGAKKIGQKTSHDILDRGSYYPQMLGYQPTEVNEDLLQLASRHLKKDGLLVFLLHVELIDLFTEEELRLLFQGPSKNNKCTKVLHHKHSGAPYVYATECARESQFLDESRLAKVIPQHAELVTELAVLQILAAGTGRILVKMRRK